MDEVEELAEEQSDGKPKTYVFYHGGCADGFCAAWAAWKKLGPAAAYLPVQHGRGFPPVGPGDTVYVVDFSFPADVLLAAADRCERVVVLDHHESAQAALALASSRHDRLSVTFDNGKSGGRLAWEHFHPGAEPPDLVRFTEDRDLWRWALRDSKAFSAALRVEPWTFPSWDALDLALRQPEAMGLFLARGRAIVDATDSVVKALCDKAFTTVVCGYAVPCVNSPVHQSEIGDELCARRPDAPFAAVWYAQDMTSRIWSLRSRNGFDVSRVAAAFGGGGHKPAASFRAEVTAKVALPPPGYEPSPASDPEPEGVTYASP